MMWTVEGKIESLDGTYGGDGAHVGIDDLSRLLAEHVGKWAKIRVELIDGPNPVPPGTGEDCITEGCKAVATLGWHCAEHHAAFIDEQRRGKLVDALKRMRTLAKRVRKHIAMVRAGQGPAATAEEQCIDAIAEAMLVVCDQIEGFDRRLQSIESRGAK